MQNHSVLKTLIPSLMALVASLMMTSQALAHPGHDHQANESMLIHVLFYGSIIVSVAVLAWFAYGYFTKRSGQ